MTATTAKNATLAALTLGALGVVYGDIGTSPLYAFREALTQSGSDIGASDIIGVLSLALWALVIVVTLKYVLFLTLATIIASQAVITGAFSLAQQGIALGLLPRMTIRQTSADQRGQIYMPVINWLLLAGVPRAAGYRC